MIVADVALARRLEAAEARNNMECRRGGGAVMQIAGGGYAVFMGATSPLTRAVGLGLSGAVAPADLERLEAFFRDRGAVVTIDLCPLAHVSLVESLARRAYRLTEFNTVLVRSLAPGACFPDDPAVSEAADADLWARTAGYGFFEHQELTPEEMDIGMALFHSGMARCFLARTPEGAPAAAAAMGIYEGLATLFGDGTVPRFRRRGLQSALIRARLNRAAAQGCDLATATTLPGSASQRNYERLGFQVAYTKAVLVRGWE